MHTPLNDAALNQLFRHARTYPTWQDKPVSDEQLQALHDLLIMGPTSMNCLPARFLYLQSPEGKARLFPALMAGNVEKTKQAPLTVIVAYAPHFHEHLPKLWPHNPQAQDMFADNTALRESTARLNGILQGAYLIMAARALGLDTGPMAGFDNGKVDEEFFPDPDGSGKTYRSLFLINVGYGDEAGLHPRGPRFTFAEAAEVL